MNNDRTLKARLTNYGGPLLVVAWTLFPVIWILSLSFKPESGINNQKFLPDSWTLENYRTVFRTELFTSALRNSIVISLIATLLSVMIATVAAYAIARLEFPGKKLILSLALAIAMFPAVSLVGPLFDIWRSIGLYDTWLGLIIPYMSFTLPLSIWTLSAFFREIPWEMEQAAQIDGATPWQAFRKVIVPLAAPGVFTAAILAFFFAWNDFVFGISLTSTDAARPVPAALAFFTGASQFQRPAAAISAAAVVVTIPVVILVLLFQRRIVAGLTAGAVKG
jgi:multiple sugar transport system permease protein